MLEPYLDGHGCATDVSGLDFIDPELLSWWFRFCGMRLRWLNRPGRDPDDIRRFGEIQVTVNLQALWALTNRKWMR